MNSVQRLTISLLTVFAVITQSVAPLAQAEIPAQAALISPPADPNSHPPVDPAIEGLVKVRERTSDPAILGLADFNDANNSARKILPIKVQKLAKHDFSADEDVNVVVSNPDDQKFSAKITDKSGKPLAAMIDQVDTGTSTELHINASNQFQPGKYTLTITDKEGNSTKQDFTWGVLAINPDKAVYQANEDAFLSLAVLDELGEMVCDAKVTLDITTPTGAVDTLSTANGKIVANKICTQKVLTTTPDYEAHYKLGGEGDYSMHLTAVTKNGTYSISDTMSVNAAAAFTIKRTSATRLYPPFIYPMKIEITANRDFTGVVTETVPESFEITPSTSDTSYTTVKPAYLADNDPQKAIQQSVLGASTTKLQMPFDGNFAITQGFGQQMTDHGLTNFYSQYGLSGHDGVDFGLPMGTPLYAVDDAKVLLAGPGDYGNTIVLEHSWGRTYYGHLSEVKVTVGTTIPKGSLLGYSGNSGESTGPHLHFGMKPNNADKNNGYGGKVDPLPYLPIGGGAALSQALPMLGNEVLGASTSANSSIASESAATLPPASEASSAAILSASSSAATVASSAAVQTFSVLQNQIDESVSVDSPVKQEVKVIQWNVSMKKGEKQTLSYQFKAPHISPQFYLVGPVRFFESEKKDLVYQEPRSWQLAADSVAVNVLFMDGGSDTTKGTVNSSAPDGVMYENPPFNSVVTSNTQVHSGQRSIKFSTGAGAVSAILHTNTDFPAVKDAGNRISFWMYLDKYPGTTDGEALIQVYDQTDATFKFQGLTLDDATHKLYLAEDFVNTSATAIQLNTWYHITISWTITSTTVNQFRLFINGNQELSGSNETLSGTGVGLLRMGFVDSGAGAFTANANMYIDDLYIDDGSNLDDPGAVRVAHKRPFANGTSNPWTTAGSGSGYGSGHAPFVNEQPSSTTNKLTTTTTNSQENFDVEGPSVGDQDITGTRIIGYQSWVLAHASTSCTGQIVANGATSNISLTTNPFTYVKSAVTSDYPSSTAKVGVVSCSSAATTSFDEGGMSIAYLPGRLDDLMRHGQYFDTAGVGGTSTVQPFSW